MAPERWRKCRIKDVSTLKGRLGWQGLSAEEYQDEGPYVVSSAHFLHYRVDWDACPHVSEDRYKTDANIQLRPGDILLMKDGAALGKLAYLDALPGPACLNSHLLLFRPRDGAFLPRYIFYVLTTALFQDYIGIHGTGATFLGVSQEAIGNFKMALPPLDQQRQIVEFLDRRIATIDDLIRKKECLVALLVEKRQALITQIVTKGLDQHLPMKESGIEWLERIPAHWMVERVRFVFHERSLPPRDGDGVVTAFRDGQVILRERRRSDGFMVAEKEIGYQHVCEGDLVVHSMDAFAGAIGVSEDDGKCTPEYIVLVPKSAGTSNEYFAALLRVMAQRNFIFVMCPSVRERAPRLRFITLRDMFVPVPPAGEQAVAAAQRRRVIDSFRPTIDRVRTSVDRLREYRQALITAAVTGKLDVTRTGSQTDDRVEQVAEGA
jgi:type I restriction enzyme, S subunit